MYGICICGHREECHSLNEFVDEFILSVRDGKGKVAYYRTFCQGTSWCWCIEYREPKQLTYRENT